jgi:TRAP-type C4-dicarboxylate transport system permease small subunit
VTRALDRLNAATEWAIAAMLAVLVATTLAQVYFRYFTSSSLDWSEELARYLFVWIVFLTGAVAVRRRAHIVVDVAVTRLPRSWQRALGLVTAALALLFFAFLTVYGLVLVRLAWSQTTPGMGISRGYLFLAVPVGSALMLVNLLVECRRSLGRGADPASPFAAPGAV